MKIISENPSVVNIVSPADGGCWSWVFKGGLSGRQPDRAHRPASSGQRHQQVQMARGQVNLVHSDPQWWLPGVCVRMCVRACVHVLGVREQEI